MQETTRQTVLLMKLPNQSSLESFDLWLSVFLPVSVVAMEDALDDYEPELQTSASVSFYLILHSN